jgi:hypothetical protein
MRKGKRVILTARENLEASIVKSFQNAIVGCANTSRDSEVVDREDGR